MDSIFEKYAVAGVPNRPAGSAGNPTDGGPGVPATIMGAYFVYGILTEILNVITAGGLTPDISALNQMALAIEAMIKASTVTYGTLSNGYRSMPAVAAGAVIIEQWAVVAAGGSTWSTNPLMVTVNYPIPFPANSAIPRATIHDTNTVTSGEGLTCTVFSTALDHCVVAVTRSSGPDRAFDVSVEVRGN